MTDAIKPARCFTNPTIETLSSTMRAFVTGEKGFLAKNFPQSFSKYGFVVVSGEGKGLLENNKGEPCVHSNNETAWADFFRNEKIDLVVHNAAVVGTDVVALNQRESTLTNVGGTHTISRAAQSASVPVCYMGTSVIYDTPAYQDSVITEASVHAPGTFYGAQKLSGEHIVRACCDDWLIMRPLFAYGGVGDMNSLPAKTYYAHKSGAGKIDMFLNPQKRKDYMHVNDFCDAVALACSKGLWGRDYNVSAEEPLMTSEIVQMMSEIANSDLNEVIQWHPDTDYLGNHLLSSETFRKETGWSPGIQFREGLMRSYASIFKDESDYNPLEHLQKAETLGTDLAGFYPKSS